MTECLGNDSLGGGNSNIYYFHFHPLFEEDEPILTSIFSDGWRYKPPTRCLRE